MIRCALLGLLIASNTSVAGTGALSLKVTALDPAVKSGSKVMIQVTTINRSNLAITYHNTARYCIRRGTAITRSRC